MITKNYKETTKSDLENMMNKQCHCSLAGRDFETWYNRTGKSWPFLQFSKEELKPLYEALPTVPEVGMGGSIYYYSDVRAVTVVKVEFTKSGKPKRVIVAHNDYEPGFGDLKVLDTYDPTDTDVFTLRRGGGWYAEGEEKSRYSTRLSLGSRYTHISEEY